MAPRWTDWDEGALGGSGAAWPLRCSKQGVARALAFRNLTIAPDAPVSEWPTEAVQAALERGDLADWHRLVTEIRADPWGNTARQVEEVLSHSRPYGVAEAMETVLSRARDRAAADERAAVAAEITEAVKRAGLSRAAFASESGPPPAAVHLCLWQGQPPSATLLLRIRRVADGRVRAMSGTQETVRLPARPVPAGF